MKKITIESLQADNDMRICARLWIRRTLGKVMHEDDPQIVAIAVNESFGGDPKRFAKWANDYIANGCGISG